MSDARNGANDPPTLGDVMAAVTGLRGEVGSMRDEVTGLRGEVVRTLRDEMTDLRVDVMKRMDIHQDRLEAMFRDISVNWFHADRVEKKVEADREQINSLVKTINELVRMNRALEGRVAALEEKRPGV